MEPLVDRRFVGRSQGQNTPMGVHPILRAERAMTILSGPDSSPIETRFGAGRWWICIYGLTCYTAGVTGLVALILLTLGTLPVTGGLLALRGDLSRTAFNLGLVAAFGVQHAAMASAGFKRWFRRALPATVERLTLTAMAGLLVVVLVWLWQPLPARLWHAETVVLRHALLGLCAAGWSYLLLATFAIDHFELFGVKQAWRYLTGKPTPEPALRVTLMYRFDRHPIMTGVLVGIWSAPTMTLDRLVMALGFTGYIIVGVAIEERALRLKHGVAYERYARRVRSIVPPLPR